MSTLVSLDELYGSFDLDKLAAAIVDEAGGDRHRLSEFRKAAREACASMARLRCVLDLEEVREAWKAAWAVEKALARV